MSDELAGLTALVTGAGKGIGREIALAFARAGAEVGLSGTDNASLIETRDLISGFGGSAVVAPADIRSPDQVAGMVNRVLDTLGRIDVLVCNSGVPGPSARLWEISPVDWEETLRVNLTGTFLCCRAVLPAMIERRTGSIIVVGSITGKRPLQGRTPYATSKLGLVGMVRTLAWETGPHGIRVNLISPGYVAGARIDRVIEAQAQVRQIPARDARAELVGASPLGRLTHPEDVAAGAVFLASSAAASITGEDLNVAAGVVMY
jgi:NAD(P)-dependent dehydrogenase (short-subunit alcohol dehydrogenase family)